MRIFFCLLLCTTLQAMSKPASSTEMGKNIGVHTLQYEDAKRNGRPVVVEVWYPTSELRDYDVPKDSIWIHPKEIRDAKPNEGKFPIIMMSHGHGGDRRDRSWLVEHLVQNGYIVASVEHHGNSWRTYNLLLSLRFWERAKDVSFALSKLVREPFFKRYLKREQVGFIGYSLGGMTGLALAGAQAKNIKQVVEHLQASFKEIDPKIVAQVDFDEGQRSFADPRIKALALLSPAAFVFPPESIQKIKVPVAVVASKGDEVLPFQDHALKVVKHLKGNSFKLLKDRASHYVFLNRVSDLGKNVIRQEMRTEQIQEDRKEVHKEVGSFVLEFFRNHLSH